MKNKNKINYTNVFIGLLMGAAVLVFGWQIYLQQHPAPEAQPLDSSVVDQMLEKKTEAKTENFAGTWTSEGEDAKSFTLNEDGTVSDLEGVSKWSAEGSTLTLVNADGTETVIKLMDDGIVIEEVVYKK